MLNYQRVIHNDLSATVAKNLGIGVVAEQQLHCISCSLVSCTSGRSGSELAVAIHQPQLMNGLKPDDT